MMERRMKDSGIPWIGVIPEEWSKDKVLRIFQNFGSGTTPKGEGYYVFEDDKDSISWINSGDLNFGYLNKVNKYISFKALKEISALKVYPPDSIIIAMYGASIGKVAISKIYGCTNQACQVLYNTKEDLKYLFYLFYAIKDRWIELSFGGTQPNINADNIKQTWLPLPSVVEQKAIAAWLDGKCGEIDELIEVEQKMIEELEAYRQATITEAVTHGLNPDVPMRQTGISWLPVIPANWEIKSFKEYFSTSKGLSITKADLTDSGIPVINYGQIHSKLNKGTGVSNEIIKFVPEFYINTDPKSLVNKGDFIFADTSEDVLGCGNCAYIDTEDTIFAGYHSIIARSKKQSSKYLAYLFKTNAWRSQIQCQVNGIKVYSVSQAMLGTTKIVVPPLDEQQAIADYLDGKCREIDDLIAVKREKIETLKQYRQSIIFEAVTGKIQIN